MGWTFFWMMVVLKLPIAALLYIVWWAIKQHEPEPDGASGDGGIKPRHRPPLPRRPRSRGPHGAPGAAPPVPRVRSAPLRAHAGGRVGPHQR